MLAISDIAPESSEFAPIAFFWNNDALSIADIIKIIFFSRSLGYILVTVL